MRTSTFESGTPDMSSDTPTTAVVRVGRGQPKTPWDLFWPRFERDRAAVTGLIIVLGLTVLAVAAPFIKSFDSSLQDLPQRRAAPSREHVFGLDHLGRDILSRVSQGARYTLGAATSATIIALTLGVAVGLTAGY